MNVSEAREFLGVSIVATSHELVEAVDRRIVEAVRSNRIELARKAVESHVAILVSEDRLEPAKARDVIDRMSVQFTSIGAKLDQQHSSIAEAEEVMVSEFAKLIELTDQRHTLEAQLADAYAERDRLLVLRQEAFDKLQAQRFASARRTAVRRIQRRKLITHIKSFFVK